MLKKLKFIPVIIFVILLLMIKSYAGILPHYSGNIEIDFKNYNNNTVKVKNNNNEYIDLEYKTNGDYVLISEGKTTIIKYFLFDINNTNPILHIEITNNDGSICELVIDGSSYYSAFGENNSYNTFITYDCDTGKYSKNIQKIFINFYNQLSFEIKIILYGLLLIIIVFVIYLIFTKILKNKKTIKTKKHNL